MTNQRPWGFHQQSAGTPGARAHRSDGEAGETLMELLATIVLMGIGILGILGALFTLVNVSDQVQQASRANLGAHGHAEWLKNPLGDFRYQPCAGPTDYPTFTNVPAGYTAEIVGIRYWTGGTAANRTMQFSSSCAAPADDKGLQEITIKVTSKPGPRQSTETVVVTKRDSRCLVVYDNADGKPC